MIKMLAHIIQVLESNSTELSVTDIYGQRYILDNHQLFTTYALNVLLVLEGKRLAYRVDISRNGYNRHYAKLAEIIDDRLTVYQESNHEPYIILKENYDIVNKIFEEEKEVIAIGKILGYSYVGLYWCNLSLCDVYYTISFSVTKDEQQYNLYSFNIPAIRYNQKMIDDILCTKKKFQQILEKEQCDVIVNHIFFTKDNIEMKEGLPTLS